MLTADLNSSVKVVLRIHILKFLRLHDFDPCWQSVVLEVLLHFFASIVCVWEWVYEDNHELQTIPSSNKK